ncbi:hypothetical protein I4F81_010051 [Pyropia yezoensis]|uniref:Uncharacterized protein n=1 Tax=Pyropia yezoensis TaxID=2788 RepID=A0ACC3CC61_PYRYE|nr:hypothetical protein I4F81_010051 [Neopyropia yezoensis]
MAPLRTSLAGAPAWVFGLPAASRRLWTSPLPVASSVRPASGAAGTFLPGSAATVPVAESGSVRAALQVPPSAAPSAPAGAVSPPRANRPSHAGAAPAAGASPPSPVDAPATVRVPADRLRAACSTILSRAGYPAGQVAMMVDVLLYGQLSGSSQTVAKLVSRGVGSLAGPTRRRGPTAAAAGTATDVNGGGDDETAADDGGGVPAELVEVVSTPVAARLDATGVPGMVAMTAAADAAVARARSMGIGLVATAGSVDGTGAIGYYARRVAAAGFFCLAASGASPPLVAPVGASAALVGTNPLAFGIPYGGSAGDDADGLHGSDGGAATGAVVADIGTSAMSYWEVARMADDAPLPAGVALTTDGAEAATAAAAAVLRPFGGPRDAHKGSALGLLVEWLTGPLVGATVVGGAAGGSAAGSSATDGPAGWGNFVLAIDPGLLRSRAAVLGETSGARGVPVEAAVWAQLQALAA